LKNELPFLFDVWSRWVLNVWMIEEMVNCDDF